jgi:hypothetical protein
MQAPLPSSGLKNESNPTGNVLPLVSESVEATAVTRSKSVEKFMFEVTATSSSCV